MLKEYTKLSEKVLSRNTYLLIGHLLLTLLTQYCCINKKQNLCFYQGLWSFNYSFVTRKELQSEAICQRVFEKKLFFVIFQ